MVNNDWDAFLYAMWTRSMSNLKVFHIIDHINLHLSSLCGMLDSVLNSLSHPTSKAVLSKTTNLPGKNPEAYLWKETVMTLGVNEKASSTPSP